MTGTEAVRSTPRLPAVKGARLKHTVTVADRISSRALAPIVLIFARKSEVGGAPRMTLSTSSRGVKATLSKNRRTVTYTIRASKLRAEAAISKRQRSSLGRQRLLRQSRLGTWHPPRRAEAEGTPVRRRSGLGRGPHEPAHQLGGLRVVQPLLARERAPGGEAEGVADGCSHAVTSAPTRGTAGHEHVASRGEVLAEAAELALHRRHDRLVAQQVLQHALGAPVVGIELGEPRFQSLVRILDRRPAAEVGHRVGGHPVRAARRE